jgi:predicted signal transduction protein with EAL and GGDEF domain
VGKARDRAQWEKLSGVAEGVENEPTARTLTGCGADLLQGYRFSRPVPADRLTLPGPVAGHVARSHRADVTGHRLCARPFS